MEYLKPQLTYEEQADLLLRRGLIANRSILIERLKTVNYYRLSGYLFPFRQQNDTYISGTTLDTIWGRYTFDRRLRLMIMDSIERFEVAIKTKLIYHHAHTYGPFGYTDASSLPLLKPERFSTFMTSVSEEASRSKEIFVKHFFSKYGDHHTCLPIWMMGEIMSFGTLFTFFRGTNSTIKQLIASDFGIQDVVLESWLGCINTVRNICAHHSRLWNRHFGYKPRIPDKDIVWRTPFAIPNDRVFGVLSIFRYILKQVAPQSKWPSRFQNFLSQFPNIPINEMGFRAGWENHTLWK